MQTNLKSPFDGDPKTIQETDENGGAVLYVAARSLTADAAQAAEVLVGVTVTVVVHQVAHLGRAGVHESARVITVSAARLLSTPVHIAAAPVGEAVQIGVQHAERRRVAVLVPVDGVADLERTREPDRIGVVAVTSSTRRISRAVSIEVFAALASVVGLVAPFLARG